MPAGLLVTVPLPVPASVTVRANCVAVNVAVTLWAWFIVTWQLPVPVQAPLHPQTLNHSPVWPSVSPGPAVIVRRTCRRTADARRIARYRSAARSRFRHRQGKLCGSERRRHALGLVHRHLAACPFRCRLHSIPQTLNRSPVWPSVSPRSRCCSSPYTSSDN